MTNSMTGSVLGMGSEVNGPAANQPILVFVLLLVSETNSALTKRKTRRGTHFALAATAVIR